MDERHGEKFLLCWCFRVKHSLLKFHRQNFLCSVVTELSRVPVVLGVHARKDSMSSFRDVTWLFKMFQVLRFRSQMTKTMVDGKNSIRILGILDEVKKIIQKCKVPPLSSISFTPFDVRNQQVVSTNNGNKVVHLLCRRENMEVVPFQSFSCCHNSRKWRFLGMTSTRLWVLVSLVAGDLGSAKRREACGRTLGGSRRMGRF